MKVYHDNYLTGIENVLNISSRYHKKNAVIPTHWHDFLEFEIVIDGEIEHNVNGVTYTATPGSACVITRLNHHGLRVLKDVIIINIAFSDVSNEITPELLLAMSVTNNGFVCKFTKEQVDRIVDCCVLARKELQSKGFMWRRRVMNSVESVLIEAIRCSEAIKGDTVESTKSPLIQNVVAYLHTNFSKDLSIASVADHFGVSAGHLGILFKKNFGSSMVDYLGKLRMKQACNLLENGHLSAKEIAAMCGFSSPEYFFYSFKKHVGMTPGGYKKAITNASGKSVYQLKDGDE